MIPVSAHSKLIFDLKMRKSRMKIKNKLNWFIKSFIFEQWAVNNKESIYAVGSK